MHCDPAVQQSDDTWHFSYSFEHPVGGGTHSSDPASSPPAERQKPLQHSSPDWHDAPFAWHGLSTQKPRRLSAVGDRLSAATHST